MKRWTKKLVEQWCAERGITIKIERWEGGLRHVHLDIDSPTPKIFRATGTHNVGMWDEDSKPDWNAIGKDLDFLDFGDCTDPECEYCLNIPASRQWVAMYLDATGLPRAWGAAPTKTDAEAIAKIELEAYRETHSDRQEPFTLKMTTSEKGERK
jgi:hypothetical protein